MNFTPPPIHPIPSCEFEFSLKNSYQVSGIYLQGMMWQSWQPMKGTAVLLNCCRRAKMWRWSAVHMHTPEHVYLVHIHSFFSGLFCLRTCECVSWWRSINIDMQASWNGECTPYAIKVNDKYQERGWTTPVPLACS